MGCSIQVALELYVLTKRTKHMYQLFIAHDEGATPVRYDVNPLVQTVHTFLNLPGRCVSYTAGRIFTSGVG